MGDFCVFETKEERDGGAGEVDVEDTNRAAREGEGECELGRYRGFANTALAGEDLVGGVSGGGTQGGSEGAVLRRCV